MILIIDNYDSFTYNLVHLVGGHTKDFKVYRNDRISLDEIMKMQPSHIILSPGSGYPSKAGICRRIIAHLKKDTPILGVGLGYLAICEEFGASIIPVKKLVHGKECDIHIANGSKVFFGLPPIISGASYHSITVDRYTLPDDLLVIAEDKNGEVMGVKHSNHELYGLLFNPESILTPKGDLIIQNFLKIGGGL